MIRWQSVVQKLWNMKSTIENWKWIPPNNRLLGQNSPKYVSSSCNGCEEFHDYIKTLILSNVPTGHCYHSYIVSFSLLYRKLTLVVYQWPVGTFDSIMLNILIGHYTNIMFPPAIPPPTPVSWIFLSMAGHWKQEYWWEIGEYVTWWLIVFFCVLFDRVSYN